LRFASALAANKNITSLNLAETNLKTEAFSSLCKNLQNIYYLNLQKNLGKAQNIRNTAKWLTNYRKGGTQGAIALAEALKTNKNLQTLDIRDNEIGPEVTISV